MGCRCNGVTESGKRCKLKRKFNDFCKTHEYQKEDCSICFDVIKRKEILECEHKFCKNCILKWMCTSYTCPLCRNTITDQTLIKQSSEYGLKNKLLIYVDEYYVDMSSLDESETELLEFFGINTKHFMSEEDWNSTKGYIDQSTLDKLHITHKRCIVKLSNVDDWDFFNEHNVVYLFD
jgi:hypothetical protein